MKKIIAGVGVLAALSASADEAGATPFIYNYDLTAYASAQVGQSGQLDDPYNTFSSTTASPGSIDAHATATGEVSLAPIGLSGTKTVTSLGMASTSVTFIDDSEGTVTFGTQRLEVGNNDFPETFVNAGYGSAFVYYFGASGAGSIDVSWTVEYTGLSAEHWMFNAGISEIYGGYQGTGNDFAYVPVGPTATDNGNGTYSFSHSGTMNFAFANFFGAHVLVFGGGNSILAYPNSSVNGEMTVTFHFKITDSDGGDNGGGGAVPEPLSLALAGIGAASLAARGRASR